VWVMTRDYLDRSIDTLAGNDSFSFGDCALGLIVSDIVPTVNTKLVDLEEAGFTGYARYVPATWTGPYVGPEGQSYEEAPAKVWANGSDTIPETVTGQMMCGVGADSTTLYGVEMLDDFAALTGPGVALTIVPRVGMPSGVNYGSSLAST
jgi:hypothetical protein